MADLKPIGSEKLTGQAKINRIMEIARYGEVTKNEEYHTSTLDFSKQGADGNLYAIVYEKDGYYLKSGLNESSLDYIDGLSNKRKNKFRSYGAALRRMNLIFKPLNEEHNDGNPISMYEQEEKFVLNVPSDDSGEEDMEMDMDLGDEDIEMGLEDDMGDEELDMGDMEGDDEEPMGDYMKPIQKLTGKLGQKLREVQEELGSDDIKYVINSIISAVELDNLTEEDKDEILERFEEDEDEYGMEPELDLGDEEMDMGIEDDMEVGDDEMGDEMELEMENIKKRKDTLKETVESTIKSYFNLTDKEKTGTVDRFIKGKLSESREMDIITKNLSSIEQELSVKKIMKESDIKFSHVNKNDGIVLISEIGKVEVSKDGKVSIL